MFGPNNKPSIHHREVAFENLYKQLEDKFKRKLNVPGDYELLFITGSGTLAIEIVLKSLLVRLTPFFTDSEFGKRIETMNSTVNNNVTDINGIIYPLYETSISRYQNVSKVNEIKVLDMVSAFPYYNIPEDTDIWVTVSGKQIGVDPGISIIGIKPHIYNMLKSDEMSYLSLSRYINYKKIYQTPNTPAIQILQSMNDVLDDFNITHFRDKINKRRDILERYFPDNIGTGPVFTFSPPQHIKEEFQLYGKNYTQIFLWSGTDLEYKTMFNKLEKLYG